MGDGKMKSHRDLEVWKKAMELAREVYALTKGFPADERFGLTNQVRRAVVSVASNIAEGAARGSHAEFIRFLRIALGSLAEVETQLLLATDLGYVHGVESVVNLVGEIRGLACGLVRHLESRIADGRPGAVRESVCEYAVVGSEDL